MSWILWVVLCFQAPGIAPESSKSLDAVAQADLERETMRRSVMPPDRVAAATARRSEQALNEREFVNRFNRLMHALTEFAHAYDTQHSVDVKRLKLVKQALRDLEKNDEWFKDFQKR